MENRLMSVQDVMRRYQCSAPTARTRMREMRHVEIRNGKKAQLMVWLWDMMAWEQGKTVDPEEKKKKKPAVTLGRSRWTEDRVPRRKA